MSDKSEDSQHHPSTFKAVRTTSDGIEWTDHATIHEKDDGQGLFDAFKSLHSGSLAQMVRMVSQMPEGEREKYVIQKAGDHQLGTAEIMALAGRDDFPAQG